MPQITEWEFTADIASRINLLLQSNPDLPFGEARAEARARGSAKRRDLTLYGRSGKPILTGEVKMPDNPQGRNPFHQTVVEDAHRKADAIGVNYNFTWNVNRFVLWNTYEQGKPITERAVEHFHVLPAPIANSDDVLQPRVSAQIDQFLLEFLRRFAALLSGEMPLRLLPLDEKFIIIYEASLEQPVAQTLAAMTHQHEHSREFKRHLDNWMRDEQGWVLSSDEATVRENLERAAKFSCYVLANKIVFYKALRRRFPKLRALKVPNSVTKGLQLGQHLAGLFKQAIEVTGDYETVFQGGFGDGLPFVSDGSVESWRDLSEQTDGFDFTQFDHEIIGQIFERLLSTEERHKYGQHYTRSEVVDLINAFCIRTPTARVLDPACGGGTFLVRAYNRKRALSGGQLHHRDLIRQLYGFDISTYPVHLTTINLVTRDLVDEANYPLVARRDFFRVRREDAPFVVPFGGQAGQMGMETIGKVDAVVGNPPYVRQEKITEYYGAAYKRFLQDEVARKEAPTAALSGRSDLHVFFFPHAASFLEDGGYLGLLTSSTWLDTAYGFRLQKYLLDNFEVIAIIESASEPWFTGARVTTAATILRKQPDPAQRAANTVHFVKLQRELSDILNGHETDEARQAFFERLRDHVEGLTENEATADWRVRCIRQDALYELGRAKIELAEGDEDETENGNTHEIRENGVEYDAHPDDYVGYKWGIFLRAPDLFFKLRDRAGDRLVPLGEIAEVKFGLKSGADDFFYPRDVTESELKRLTKDEFIETYGVRPSDTNKVRVVFAGDGSAHLLEKQFLEPEVHSLMEIDSFEIELDNLRRRVLLSSKSKTELRAQGYKHVLNYIRWGEKEELNLGRTVQSRVDSGKLWYDLTAEPRPDIILPKLQQYRHIIALNPQGYLCNSSLLEVFAKKGQQDILAAILNSTIVALTKQFFARMHGREGSLQLDVYSAQMMLTPDLRQTHKDTSKRILRAFKSMRARKALPLVDVDATSDDWSGELAMEDRQELDDAVLELLGVAGMRERKQLRDELYREMTRLYREIRATEKKMQKFRTATARRGRPTPQSLAEEIWESFNEKPAAKSLADFVPATTTMEAVTLPAGKARAVYTDMFNPNSLQVGQAFIRLGTPERVDFALALADSGISGLVTISVEAGVCAMALQEYREYFDNLSEVFANAAAGYTSDEQLQTRIVNELWRRAGRKQ